MQRPGRRWFFGFIGLALTYIILTGIGVHVTPGGTFNERLENAQWVASSRSWIDRQLCRWFELCGTYHMLNRGGWTWSDSQDDIPDDVPKFAPFWESGEEDPDSWSHAEKASREIPDYVFKHAPYVHLFSGEQFWPSDVAEHLTHMSPRLNYTLIPKMANDRNLTNLNDLDDIEAGRHGRYVYLQSDDNVEEHPDWLTSQHNIPSMPESWKPSDEDASWPDDDDELMVGGDVKETGFWDSVGLPSDLTPSDDGRCGGNSGSTCKGSRFGQCCSISGWCGKSDLYCDTFCDPLHGECADLLNPPPPNPRPDLRKRSIIDEQTPPTVEPANTDFGRSKAPAILIVSDKGNGTVDAFWFFFYSFNLGQKVLNIRFGNHVGDWEHTAIRFVHGKPTSVFFSEHDFGAAYSWAAVEKYLPNPDGSGTMLGSLSNVTVARAASRPVAYSAVGSHAMYATPGLHPYVLPWGLLHDQTDRGPIWDPTLNLKSFIYNASTHTSKASTLNPYAPTSWLDYAGHWGDKYYPLGDPRQYRFAGQYHYVNGPTGPAFKRLGRKDICQNRGVCHVRHWLGKGRRKLKVPESLPADGGGDEEGGLPGGNSTDDAY
ncbi:Vacuolar protein sorting-associated protein 62 [Recurvomyces mirabilis]|nr:Vacuolar protein sorting-associated protein 62 [Recurvomyces mirabilis]